MIFINMNLHDDILRVKNIMGILSENREKELTKFMNKEGIIFTSKMVGGYNNLIYLLDKNKIPKKLKINAIKEYTQHEGGMSFSELGEEPIFYQLLNAEVHQIEYLALNYVVVQVYGGYKHSLDMGEYNIHYENLSDEILDKILETIC